MEQPVSALSHKRLMEGEEQQSVSGEEDSESSSDYDSSSEKDTQTTSSGNSGGSSSGLTEQRNEIRQLIEKETKDVILWREVVTGVMVITACFVSVATYIFLSREEVNSFSRGFQEVASRLSGASEKNMATLLESFEGLSDVLSSFGNGAWPLVTIPDFATHAEHTRAVTGALALWWAPYVSLSNKPAWELHSRNLCPLAGAVYPSIYEVNNRTIEPSTGMGPFCPVGQINPSAENLAVVHSPVNYDMLSDHFFTDMIDSVSALGGRAALSGFAPLELFRRALEFGKDDLMSLLMLPIYEETEHNGPIVGVLQGILSWGKMFSDILNDESEAVYCVLRSTCGNEHNESFTYYISSEEVTLEGEGELFLPQYESHKFTTILMDDDRKTGACSYSIDLYPSIAMRESYKTEKPELYTGLVAMVFFLMIIAFFAYEKFVQRRNDKVVSAAARTNAIVSSMFPGNVRDRLLAAGSDKDGGNARSSWLAPTAGLKNFLQNGKEDSEGTGSKPLADLFPETTILFADLVGFTAWSSVREPSQVFTLLETIFRAFDQLARRRRIFKVETVGDCYVAVAGLPEPRKDHAVAMARFSEECLRQVRLLTKKMEVQLGPDTGELTIRIGMHSGPVTAGVLRGERARFQLFGDTMNTAARMEQAGTAGRIQISQETADLLVEAGKSHWIRPREDVVYAKGKGEMQTFWLKTGNKHGDSESTRSSQESSGDGGDHHNWDLGADGDGEILKDNRVKRLMSSKIRRLVDWNVEVLAGLLRKIVARQTSADTSRIPPSEPPRAPGATVLDEVKEIIALPEFDAEADRLQQNADLVDLPREAVDQLHQFCSNVAVLYHDNPFHNFEHASHVTMSVTKLLGRIVAPSDVLNKLDDGPSNMQNIASSLHDHTYGITSDPLTQFACVLSALIHDCDHQGVPNSQLVKEESRLASLYKEKSIAEQNSIDLAWDLLMDGDYEELRALICPTQVEFCRFRQLVVNSVLATDIMDKDLKMLRNARWETAFSKDLVDANERDGVNRKATIVIEHLIQASDVAHTMQHWHVYRKWNERFFRECYKAYKEGRADKDPSEGWYKGEIGFFDFYIIPLAKKLKDCGVFGVSSDEYLNYAEKNRKEWEARGREVVSEMLQSVKEEF